MPSKKSPYVGLELTHERLLFLFSYDEVTGIFYRKISVSTAMPGECKIKPDADGYLSIRIDGKIYRAHRLAWFFVHKSWPKKLIDHINGKTDDNRICNLREATNSENHQNLSKKAQAATGLRGASVNKNCSTFRASIQINNRKIYLGRFKTAELAHEAYLEAKKKYHTFNPEFLR